jgi:flagellar biosynthesis/type III secretory pathway M-ring protein FliF/YscJ
MIPPTSVPKSRRSASLSKIFEEKIKSFLEPVFGKSGMSVSVNVVVDFNRKTSEEVSYFPVIGDNGIISWVERHNENTSDEGALGGDVPTYSEDAGNAAGGSTSRQAALTLSIWLTSL